MKIVILTTKTEHHDYFINKLKHDEKDISIIYEKRKNKFSFKTNHRYYKKRDQIEKNFFQNKKIKKNVKKKFFFDVNSQVSINYIYKLNPHIIISFGVGLIKKKFLKKFKRKILLNLHGGNPEFYRGLDSHLWCVYHKDFKNLLTTLHTIDRKFDTGDILYSKKILKTNEINFYNLRIFNTKICIELVNKLILDLKNGKKLRYKKQKTKGRYYSAIPASLIEDCKKNFRKWTERNNK